LTCRSTNSTARRHPRCGASSSTSASTAAATGSGPLQIQPRGNGLFDVTILHLNVGESGGTVSLRTEAWDDVGNRVEQTVLDAYRLTSRR
jgi:hypothetical protein